MQRWFPIATFVVVAAAADGLAAQPADISTLLTRIGERVEQYYARAQSIVFTETVRLEPMSLTFQPERRVRRLVYELRVSWEPGGADGEPPDVNLVRELVKVDGRAPRPGDEPECLDPQPVTAEPLAMLLPGHRREYAFTWRGTARHARRDSVMLDYKATTGGPAEVRFTGNCVYVEIQGRTRGRIWVDTATSDVLRLDAQLVGMFEFPVPKEYQIRGGPAFMVIERADSSIRYQPVTFSDPNETVLLPSSVQTMTVIRNSPAPRVRVTQTFSNYRRFMTGGRVVRPD